MKRPTVIFCDNTSADNLALVKAATRRESLLDAQAIFVTGRAAHSDPDASIEKRDEDYSNYIHDLNARRMVEFADSVGSSARVFTGECVYRTQLRTVIEHRHHVNEERYDIWNANNRLETDGDFAAGLQFLREYEGEQLLVLVGGPLTEVALIQRYVPDVAAKFGAMFIQAGDFAEDESTNLIGGRGNSFNGACDPAALHDALYGFDGRKKFILPSNITKQRELGFATPDEIAALGANRRLVRVYDVHYQHSAKKRGTPLFIHDLGLVMLVEQYIRGQQDFPYRCEPVEIVSVPCGAPTMNNPDRRGTIVTRPAQTSDCFVVVWQDTDGYRDRVAEYLQD